jgi:hypothetical protein
MINAFLVSLALAADPATSNDAMKAALKDAVAQKPEDGPDVSKLPFTPDSIKQVVSYHQPKIQGCYEDHIANKKKPPEGTIKTSWVISADGLVKNAKVDRKASALKDQGLADCVVAVISSMTFPKPPDGKDRPIEFPFNLKAVH